MNGTTCVYLLASQPHGTLYTGQTHDLLRRIVEHRDGLRVGLNKHYGVKTLVWWEAHTDPHEAFARERRIKEWPRADKVSLIERDNPHWADLAVGMLGLPPLPTFVRRPPPR